MRILLLLLNLFCFVSTKAQSLDQSEETLWIQPFLLSFESVINNITYLDYVVLEQKYADEIIDLPYDVIIVNSVSEIEKYAMQGQIVSYICLSSIDVNWHTAQIQWKSMSAGCRDNPCCVDCKTHAVGTFIYHNNGSNWSNGPTSIRTIE